MNGGILLILFALYTARNDFVTFILVVLTVSVTFAILWARDYFRARKRMQTHVKGAEMKVHDKYPEASFRPRRVGTLEQRTQNALKEWDSMPGNVLAAWSRSNPSAKQVFTLPREQFEADCHAAYEKATAAHAEYMAQRKEPR